MTGVSPMVVGSVVSLYAALLLFFRIYTLFPNVDHSFGTGHLWQGAALAAFLSQTLTYTWPLYVVVFHPQRNGAVP